MIASNVLFIRNEAGEYVPAKADQVITEGRKLINSKRFIRGATMNNPNTVKDYCHLMIADRESEVFGVLFLDSQMQLIKFEILFQGSVAEAVVFPREVVRKVLEHNAACVILTHNHPSGLVEPSNADRTLTRRLRDALDLIDVRVLDHVIVGNGTYSMAEHGLM